MCLDLFFYLHGKFITFFLHILESLPRRKGLMASQTGKLLLGPFCWSLSRHRRSYNKVKVAEAIHIYSVSISYFFKIKNSKLWMKYKPVKFSVFGFPGVIDKDLGSNDRNDTQDTWHGQVSLDVALEEPPHYWCHFLYNNMYTRFGYKSYHRVIEITIGEKIRATRKKHLL